MINRTGFVAALQGISAKAETAGLHPGDPVFLVRAYQDKNDREVAGWLASSLAYGRRELFMAVLKRLFATMGASPWLFVKNFRMEADAASLEDLRYRFNTGADLALAVEALRRSLLRHGTLEECFLSAAGLSSVPPHSPDALVKTVAAGLAELRGTLGAVVADHPQQAARSRNPWFLFPDPKSGGPLKRPIMFARWMARTRHPDLGDWSLVHESSLVFPLDVHVFRLCRRLGLTGRKTPSMRAALEITRTFSAFEPDDPVRYDFALSAFGTVECGGGEDACPGPKRDGCVLMPFCLSGGTGEHADGGWGGRTPRAAAPRLLKSGGRTGSRDLQSPEGGPFPRGSRRAAGARGGLRLV